MNCVKCSESLPSVAKFCMNCGAAQNKEAPAVTQQKQEQQQEQPKQQQLEQHEVTQGKSGAEGSQVTETSNQPLVRTAGDRTETWSADRTEYRLEAPGRKEYVYCSPDGANYLRKVDESGDNYQRYLCESRQIRSSDNKVMQQHVNPELSRFQEESRTHFDRIKKRLRDELDTAFALDSIEDFNNSFLDAFGRHLNALREQPKAVEARKEKAPAKQIEGRDRFWMDPIGLFGLNFDDMRRQMEDDFRTHVAALDRALADFGPTRRS